jgi:hypothetical protein
VFARRLGRGIERRGGGGEGIVAIFHPAIVACVRAKRQRVKTGVGRGAASRGAIRRPPPGAGAGFTRTPDGAVFIRGPGAGTTLSSPGGPDGMMGR